METLLTVIVFFLFLIVLFTAVVIGFLLVRIVDTAFAESKAKSAERQLNASIALIDAIAKLKEMNKDKESAEVISAVDILAKEIHTAAKKEKDTPKKASDEFRKKLDKTTKDMQEKIDRF